MYGQKRKILQKGLPRWPPFCASSTNYPWDINFTGRNLLHLLNEYEFCLFVISEEKGLSYRPLQLLDRKSSPSLSEQYRSVAFPEKFSNTHGPLLSPIFFLLIILQPTWVNLLMSLLPGKQFLLRSTMTSILLGALSFLHDLSTAGTISNLPSYIFLVLCLGLWI